MHRRLAAVVAALAAVTAAACGDDEERPQFGVEPPLAPVPVATEDAPRQYVRTGAENFRVETDTDVEVEDAEPARALELLCAREVAVAATTVAPAEAACPEGGPELTGVPIGHQAVAIAVPDERVPDDECYSFEELREIWTAPADQTAVQLVGEERGRPATELFRARVAPGRQDLTEYTAVEDAPAFIELLSEMRGSQGFFSYGPIDQAEPETLKLMPVQAPGEECVDPTDESVQSGRYPLAQPLYAYATAESLDRVRVASYLRFLLENRRQLGRATPDVVPISAEQAQEALAALPQAPVPAG